MDFRFGSAVIKDGVFLGPNATLKNDIIPRSRKIPECYPRKEIQCGCECHILLGVIIGEKAMVEAGSVVTSDVPVNAVVVGNPAKNIRYLK